MQYRRDRPAGLRSLTAALVFVACAISVGATDSGTPAFAAKTTTAAKTTKATKTTKANPANAKKSGKATITLGVVRQTQLARDQVRAKKAKSSAKVNALKANQRQVEQTLANLTSNVRVTSVALDRAKRSAAQASSEAATARARVADIETKIGRLRSSRLESALAAYAQPAASGFDSYISAGNASEAGRREILDRLAKRGTADALDELTSLQEDLNIQRALADRAQRRATAYRSSVAGRLSTYQVARTKQQRYADDVENRLESQLAEAAGLAELDRGLSARLSSQNDALAKQLAKAGAGGRGGGRLVFSEIAAQGGGDTHGIKVASAIRGKLAAMVSAAQADGVYLTGGGYRSASAQVALRIAHCGSSSFAIYQQRASSCRPPTARPGASMHERGLAIDFQEGGQTLTRGSRGYAWLRKNAARYGFINLPSEAWHWSVNGR